MTEEKVLTPDQTLVAQILVSQQPYFKDLVSPFIQAKEKLYSMQDISFRQDIEEQFKENVFQTIADDLSHKTGISTEDIYIVLEDLVLENFLSM